jgi:hypothetical protein
MLILGIVHDTDQSSQSTNDKTIQDVRINNQFILRLGLFPKNENNLQHYSGMLGYFWLFVWACLFALYQTPFAGFVQHAIQNNILVFHQRCCCIKINIYLKRSRDLKHPNMTSQIFPRNQQFFCIEHLPNRRDKCCHATYSYLIPFVSATMPHRDNATLSSSAL